MRTLETTNATTVLGMDWYIALAVVLGAIVVVSLAGGAGTGWWLRRRYDDPRGESGGPGRE
ncbi:MAG TPA: hypothetical protein VD931_02715 [Baekduia sp.]|nr:hypothetical protein [Baekduia sp.]